jgi:hypothetical protein
MEMMTRTERSICVLCWAIVIASPKKMVIVTRKRPTVAQAILRSPRKLERLLL